MGEAVGAAPASGEPPGDTVKAALGGAAADGAAMNGRASIFDLYHRRRKLTILLCCAVSLALVPISDTMYLPSLTAIAQDFNTTHEMTAASVAVYMYAVGLGALLFGPVADKFGRRVTLLGATLATVGLSVACHYAATIEMLIAIRAVQGFVVTACSTTSNAILADIFAPAERGRAMGIAAVPFLVGPVIGPLLGGVLAQNLGWRSTFTALAIFAGVMFIAQVFTIPETHHYFAVKKLRATRGDAAADAIIEEVHPPHFDPPHQPLVHLCDRQLAPYALVTVLLFSTMFAAMIVLPEVLAYPPYNMNQALIGVANGVPFGMGGLLAAPVGGLMADWGARRWGNEHGGSPAGRMVVGTLAALVVSPCAALLFGWGMHFKLPAAVPLIGGVFINASMTLHMPATTSLISVQKQRYAAAAGGGLHAMQFIMAGVFVQATPIGMRTLGVGPLMTLVAGLAWLAAIASAIFMVRSLRAREAPPPAGASGDDLEAAAPAAAAGAEQCKMQRAASPASPGRSLTRSSIDVAIEGIASVQLA